MDTALKSAIPLADYRLKLTFQNGSTAVVNMKRWVRTLRFACIAPMEIFATAWAEGDRVAWANGLQCSASTAANCWMP